MACKRYGVRLPASPPFFMGKLYSFEPKPRIEKSIQNFDPLELGKIMLSFQAPVGPVKQAEVVQLKKIEWPDDAA